MAGPLINMVFQQEFLKAIKNMADKIQKEVNKKQSKEKGKGGTDGDDSLKIRLNHHLSEYFASEDITNGLRRALSTGNWGKDKDNNVLKTGVS